MAPIATTFTGKRNPVHSGCAGFFFPAQVVEEWHHLPLRLLESGTQFHSGCAGFPFPAQVVEEWHHLPLRLLESGTQFQSGCAGFLFPAQVVEEWHHLATTCTGKRNPVPFLMCWVPFSSTSSGRVAPFATTNRT